MTATSVITPAQRAFYFNPDLYDPTVTPEEHRRLEIQDYHHYKRILDLPTPDLDFRQIHIARFREIAHRYSLDATVQRPPPYLNKDQLAMRAYIRSLGEPR